MRVAIVDPGHQVPYYDQALAGALARLGTRVTLLTAPLLYYDLRPTAAGVDVRPVFGRLLTAPVLRRLPLAANPSLRRVLRAVGYGPELAALVRWAGQAQPDVVHLQWSLAPPVDAVVLDRLRHIGSAVVHTAHNVLPHTERPWHRPGFRRLYAAADRVVVHSRAARDRLLGLGGVAPDRVEVLPMPADEPGRVSDRRTARDELGFQADDPLVLFFGHVRPYKGLGVLLDALLALRRQVPGVRLLIAGPVAGGGRGLDRLRAAIAARGITDAIVLRPGYVPHSQVASCFAAADVVALPYRDTDDSAVLAAARGHGRAVVAAAVGGIPEALAAGGGLLVPPDEPDALAAALGQVLGSPATRDHLEAGARSAAGAWTWLDAAARLCQIYRELRDATR